jgi:phosphoribosylglycinamide formyltransferase-1
MMKIVFLVSKGGGVLSRILRHKIVRDSTELVAADRLCGAINVAQDQNVETKIYHVNTGADFSDAVARQFSGRGDVIFISFYTKKLTKNFIQMHGGRIFNCHPSILPACKGLHGFDETLKSNSMFIGCTLHVVDEDIDSGKGMIQAAIPLDRSLPYETNRHKVFLAQYYSTLQFIFWILRGDLFFTDSGEWIYRNIYFKNSIFSPNLDPYFFDVINESCEL